MAKIGVLLIQLGTPDEPTPSAVKRYLREFLLDPRVIEVPRWKWWFVLNLFVLPRRSRESAEKYARIWNSHSGSPLLHLTRLQAAALAKALSLSLPWKKVSELRAASALGAPAAATPSAPPPGGE